MKITFYTWKGIHIIDSVSVTDKELKSIELSRAKFDEIAKAMAKSDVMARLDALESKMAP